MNEKQLTIVILTKNEEKNLPRCLQAIPEDYPVVILDSGSTDQTIEIAQKYGCKVFENRWEGFAKQRNHALEHCGIRTEWTLFVDADEIYPLSFYEWFENKAIFMHDIDVFMIPQILIFRGKRLSHVPGYPIYHPRLVKTDSVRFVVNYAGHGETVSNIYKIHYTDIPYLHYIFEDEIAWMKKHIGNAWEEVKGNNNRENCLLTRRTKLNLMLRHSFFRIPARFFYHYLFRLGFLDGKAGFVYSLLYCWYEFTKYIMLEIEKVDK